MTRGRRRPTHRLGTARFRALAAELPRAPRPAGPAPAGPDRRGGAGAQPGHRGRRPARACDPPPRAPTWTRSPTPPPRSPAIPEEPTLGAFLAYLTAAETEEFGLETGRVGETGLGQAGHRARLQGPAVGRRGRSRARRRGAGAGLSRRARGCPRGGRRTRGCCRSALRGDATDLPDLRDLDPGALAAFTQRCADRDLAEERRLAYVAATRAAFWLACSGYWWGEGSSRSGPRSFLDEVRAACEAGAGRWTAGPRRPREDAENPALAEPPAAEWPGTPAGARYEAVLEAATTGR